MGNKYYNFGIVFGNGESRSCIDIHSFDKYNAIKFGCNAIYRDYTPDILVAVDNRMIQEILSKNYMQPFFYRDYRYRKTIISNIKELYHDKGWASGQTALYILFNKFYYLNDAYLIGMDMGSKTEKMNNIFKNTKNYNESHIKQNTNKYWLNQLSQLFRMFYNKNFYICGDVAYKDFNYKNVRYITFKEMYVKMDKYMQK